MATIYGNRKMVPVSLPLITIFIDKASVCLIHITGRDNRIQEGTNNLWKAIIYVSDAKENDFQVTM